MITSGEEGKIRSERGIQRSFSQICNVLYYFWKFWKNTGKSSYLIKLGGMYVSVILLILLYVWNSLTKQFLDDWSKIRFLILSELKCPISGFLKLNYIAVNVFCWLELFDSLFLNFILCLFCCFYYFQVLKITWICIKVYDIKGY